MTDPVGGAGGAPRTPAPQAPSLDGGGYAQQINAAAAPAQRQTGEALKASTGSLNAAAQATSPNASEASAAASGRPAAPAHPPGGGGATAAANADPNAPRS